MNANIDEWVVREWISELEQKSTLSLYRNLKNTIKEENFYDNTFGSVLLFRARTNCLKLDWRRRFEGGEVGCKLCGADEETTEHFILECRRLRVIREEFGMIDMDIGGILGFDQNEDMDKTKRFLNKIWIERKNILSLL